MSCNFDMPTQKKPRRYFFGYHLVNGIPFSMMWMEDGGLVVGGIPDVIGPRMEITEEEFNNSLLADLEKEHPLPEEFGDKRLNPSEDPEVI